MNLNLLKEQCLPSQRHTSRWFDQHQVLLILLLFPHRNVMLVFLLEQEGLH
jgi:hypothetical protein